MTEQTDARSDYLHRFDHSLAQMGAADRMELVAEIRSHIAEGEQAGLSLGTILERLGPPHRLARGYAITALVSGEQHRSPRQVVRAAAMLATMSLSSLIVVPMLLVMSVGFAISGVLAVLAGVAGLGLGPETVRISPPTYAGAMAAVAVGMAVIGVGILAGLGLRAYVSWAARALRAARLVN
jgi:uncharacterized membrane protein